MPYLVTNNSSITSQRVIPLWLVGSNGTTPATGEAGGQPTWMLGGVYYGNTTNTLSAWSANAGEYFLTLAKSETSVVGQGVVRYSSGNALEAATPFEIIAVDSFDSVRAGLTAMPNAAAAAVGGLLIVGTGAGSINPSLGSVGLVPFDYSSVVTVGVGKIAAGTYSGVSVEVKTGGIQTVSIGSATYSGVTFGANPVGDKTLYSVNSLVPGVYSGVSVEVTTGGIQTASVGKGNYSGVTVEIGNSGVTAGQAIADRIVLRSPSGGTDSGRSIGDALRALRNRIDITGASIGTVYQEDDATSAWTFSITTTANQVWLTGINPAGGSA